MQHFLAYQEASVLVLNNDSTIKGMSEPKELAVSEHTRTLNLNVRSSSPLRQQVTMMLYNQVLASSTASM